MSKTHLKKTSLLVSIFFDFGSQLGTQLREQNSKNRLFSLSWANLGQLGPKSRPKASRETQNEIQRRPKTAKMRPQGFPRQPKSDRNVSHQGIHGNGLCWPHGLCTFMQHLQIASPSSSYVAPINYPANLFHASKLKMHIQHFEAAAFKFANRSEALH